MKILSIFLTVCLAHITSSYSMEINELSAWHTCTQGLIMRIVARSDLHTKENLRSVNKQLLQIASKNNIATMLYDFPCVLHRQDHLDCMVTYAKKYDYAMLERLIKNASCCDHADWSGVIPSFLPENVSALLVLHEYKKDPSEYWLLLLLPYVVAAYEEREKRLTPLSPRSFSEEILLRSPRLIRNLSEGERLSLSPRLRRAGQSKSQIKG